MAKLLRNFFGVRKHGTHDVDFHDSAKTLRNCLKTSSEKTHYDISGLQCKQNQNFSEISKTVTHRRCKISVKFIRTHEIATKYFSQSKNYQTLNTVSQKLCTSFFITNLWVKLLTKYELRSAFRTCLYLFPQKCFGLKLLTKYKLK